MYISWRPWNKWIWVIKINKIYKKDHFKFCCNKILNSRIIGSYLYSVFSEMIYIYTNIILQSGKSIYRLCCLAEETYNSSTDASWGPFEIQRVPTETKGKKQSIQGKNEEDKEWEFNPSRRAQLETFSTFCNRPFNSDTQRLEAKLYKPRRSITAKGNLGFKTHLRPSGRDVFIEHASSSNGSMGYFVAIEVFVLSMEIGNSLPPRLL